MYVVKYGNQYIHDPFSETQRAYDVHISSDINASGTCEFTIGPSHPLYNKLELRSSSNNVTVLEDDTVLFDGYVYSFSTNYDKSRDVTCYGCLSYLGDIRLRPYATQQSDDDPPDMVYCSSTIDGLFEFYIDQYNKYAEEGRKFHMGTNEGSVIRELNSISASSDSYPTVSDELSEKLLNTVGGYVFIHHDGTERYIDYFANCTDVNAQIVDFGVNIIDFVKTDTMSGFYTALRPVGGTPNEAEGESKKFPISLNLINDGPTDVTGIVKKGDVVYNEDAVTKYGYVEGYQSYSEITDVAALEHQAAIDVKIASSIHPTIEVKAIDLALYKQGNEPLVPGQLVRVRSFPHGIDEYLLLNNMDIDISDPSNTVYTFGEAIDSLTGEQNKKAAELNASINHSLDAVAELDQTTKDQAIQIGKVEDVANDASDKADNAQNTANNAQNTANNAQNTANSNKEAIDSIKDAQTEYEKQLEQMQQGVEQAEKEIDGINDRLDQMDTEAGEVQASIDAVRQEAQTNFETAKNAADAAGQRADAAQEAVDSLRKSTSSELQNVKDSVSGVRSDVDAVEQKAADLASELDGTKATVERVTTDLGEVKTTVSNAATKADQALQVSTSASQTATEARTTATSAYQDAQSALTQSSTASQTANAVKTELETKYSTTDEIAEQYATKSLVEQTSQSIASTVEATYATKATVEALENIANNAVQTWMGSGVPTLSNKPASDWNTAELKSQHSGDIYYDTDTGYSYRFGSSDGKNYSWSLIKDTDISKAVADAAKAQQTAEGVSDEVTQLKTDIPATYATKTEFKQTTDKISATATAASQNASSALSKVGSLQVSVDGIDTKVEEVASDADEAVKTASQVSQRVDSLSRTITQVSGRVDDVEDKADAAQGTANSALSQASRVEQSLDSFKTSVSRDYQTKTDALSQKSELEQNINSFKTTVSETYTTKDEFNALEIGGTNLLRGTEDFGNPDFTSLGSFHKLDETYDGLTVVANGYSWSGVSWSGFDPEPNVSYVFSFWAKADTGLEIRHFPRYLGGPNYDPKEFILDEIYQLPHAASAGKWVFATPEDDATEWRRYWVRFHVTATLPGDFNIRIENGITPADPNTERLYLCGYKLERGTKPTAWSPAPEDFDGKYTSKTEFKQTTDKISATATAASQNASSALSKVGSLEVSVDGIDAKVEENASAIGQNTKTISQVSQKADSLSSKIEQTNTNLDVALSNGFEIIRNPNGDVSEGNLDGWNRVTLSASGAPNGCPISTYMKIASRDTNWGHESGYTKRPCRRGRTYRIEAYVACDSTATKNSGFGLSYNTVSGSTTWVKAFTVTPTQGKTWAKYSGTVTVPEDVTKEGIPWIQIDGSSGSTAIGWYYTGLSITDITEAKTATDTANSALSKSSSVEQSLNSFKTSVSQTYETKSDASNKQSSLQQSVNNLRTEVSETYTTKTDVANNYTPKIVAKNTGTGGQTGWFRVAQFKVKSNYSNAAHRVTVTNRLSQQTVINIQMASVNNVDPGLGVLTKSGPATVAMAKSTTSTWILYVQKSEAYDSLTVTRYEAPSYNPMTVTWLTDQVSTPPSGYTTATNLIGWKNETDYSTKSYVDQTSRTVSLGVVEEYKNGQHGSALATQSDITAAKDSITQTVSQTYTTKTEFNSLQVGGTNIARDTQAFGHNGVSSTEEGYLNAYVNRTNGTYKGLTVRNIISSDGPGVAVCEYLVTNVKHSEYYTLSFWAKGSGRIRTYFYGPSGYIGAKAVSASNGSGNTGFSDGQWNMTVSSSWQRYFVVYQTAASGGTSTDKYMLLRNDNDMASCDVCGVMIERGNKASDWSASPLDVSATYATKTEVKQTSDSLTVTISSAVSKAESAATAASNAQNTANTANSNAQNAQNRVGNLETCIKMTSDGVRVGKVSNGNFTGYSALVNSEGSFDILDSSSRAITSFDKNGIRLFQNDEAYRVMNVTMSGTTAQVSVGMIDENTRIPVSGFTSSGNYMYLRGGHLMRIQGTKISTEGVDTINLDASSEININGNNGEVNIDGNSINLSGPTTFLGGATVPMYRSLSIANNAGLRFVHSEVRDIVHGSTVITGNGTSHIQILSSSQVNSYGGYREGDFFQAWNGDYSANSSTIKGTSYHNDAFYVDFDTNILGSYRVNWIWIRFFD